MNNERCACQITARQPPFEAVNLVKSYLLGILLRKKAQFDVHAAHECSVLEDVLKEVRWGRLVHPRNALLLFSRDVSGAGEKEGRLAPSHSTTDNPIKHNLCVLFIYLFNFL